MPNHSAARKHYVLVVLTLIALFGAVDKVALAILLQDIKLEFQLSDTQLGLLTGIAFAAFYAAMGIPIARWADTGNRVTIISLSTALWSVGIALCGFAGSFVQLLTIRVGVAVGEAGVLPPSFSLLADYFPRSQRARAISIYGLAGALSSIVGFFAGWLDDQYGWRATLILLSIPGLVLAAVARFTLREPRLHRSPSALGQAAERPADPSVRVVLRTLLANTSFLHLLMFLSVMIFFTYGIAQWLPIFFIRSFGFTTGEVGTWFAIVNTAGGLLGALTGGELASRYAANNEKRQLVVVGAALATCGLVSVSIYLAPNPQVALALMGLLMFGFIAVTGPLIAAMQAVVPDNMRAMAFALAYLVANLLGMGIGPLSAGVLSDAFHSWAGDESVRYALLVLSPGYLWAAWHAWQASNTVARDIAIAERRQDPAAPRTEAVPSASAARTVAKSEVHRGRYRRST